MSGVLAGGLAVRPVDVDEVDVGAEVELARAQLPHGQRAEAGPRLARRQPRRRRRGGAAAGGRGSGWRRRRRPWPAPRARRSPPHAGPPQVAQRDAQHLAGAQPAQQAVKAVDVVRVEPPGGARPAGRRRAPRRARAANGERAVRRSSWGCAPAQQRRGGRRRRAARAPRARSRSGGRAPAVEVALHAGQRQVGVGGQAAQRLHLREPWPRRRRSRASRSSASAARNGAGATPGRGRERRRARARRG